jgi:hypothetical protein
MALAADRVLMKVADVSNFIAPFMILLTFFQTLALLLKFSLQWPEELKELMNDLSIFNINLDLARPECSIQWTASSKMDVTLAVPFSGAFLIACYGVSGWLFHRKDPGTKSMNILHKCESMAVGMFMVASSFFLKGILAGIDCTPDGTNGKYYLDIEPSIECDRALPEYSEIYAKVLYGLALWAALFALIVKTFLSEGGKYRYSFLTTKLEDKWFWWELILLARKLLIMFSGLFNSSATSRGWFLGSMVIIMSLAAHAFARPFKNYLVDACEFASLLSTLIIFQSGMVWNSTMDETGLLSNALEKVSIFLILLVSALGIIAQIDAIQDNASDPRNYSPGHIRQLSNKDVRALCGQLRISIKQKESGIAEKVAPELDPVQAQKREELITGMKNKLSTLGHSGFCGIWVGSTAEELLDHVFGLQDVEILRELLHFEISRQHEIPPGRRNKSMVLELQRRLRAELVIRSPMIQNVRSFCVGRSATTLRILLYAWLC